MLHNTCVEPNWETLMKKQTYFFTVILSIFSLSACKLGKTTALESPTEHSVIASLGYVADTPEAQRGALTYELYCDESPKPLLGKTTGSGETQKVIFKVRGNTTIKVGSVCRMEMWGAENNQYNFKDSLRDTDQKRLYHITTKSALNASFQLRLSAAPRYTLKSKKLFSILIKPKTDENIEFSQTATAQLTCGEHTIAQKKMQNGLFYFDITEAHYIPKPGTDSQVFFPLQCIKFKIIDNNTEYVSAKGWKSAEMLRSTAQNANISMEVEVSTKKPAIATPKGNPITDIVTQLTGMWDGYCYNVNKKTPSATPLYMSYSYFFDFDTGSKTKGNLIQVRTFYSEACGKNKKRSELLDIISDSITQSSLIYRFEVTSNTPAIENAVSIDISAVKADSTVTHEANNFLIITDNVLHFGKHQDSENPLWTKSKTLYPTTVDTTPFFKFVEESGSTNP